MAKGSKPKMKMWRREAVKHNEDARDRGDYTGHKGRALKTHGFNMAGAVSPLFTKIWASQVGAGNIYYHFTKTEQETIDNDEGVVNEAV